SVSVALVVAAYLIFSRTAFIALTISTMFGRASAAILWATIPRPARRDPPGVRLEPAAQPALFRLLAEVARATGHRPPDEVYLTARVAASVGRHGSITSLGGLDVVAVGLPLLGILTVSQLR